MNGASRSSTRAIFVGMKGAVRGIGGFFRAFPFALEHRLWWAFIVPVVLWIGLAYGLYALLEGPVDRLTEVIAGRLSIPVEEGAEGWEGSWNMIKAFVNGARSVIVAALLHLAIAYLLYTFNKYLVLILLSPLLAYVSERAESTLTGRDYPFSATQLVKDVWRGILIALRNGALELLITLATWIATVMVPVLAPFAAVFLFLVSAYFYGFSMFDYVFERRRMRVGASVRAVNQRMGMVLANGALFSLVMMVPLLGMCLAPPLAAIGAVLAMRDDAGAPAPEGRLSA